MRIILFNGVLCKPHNLEAAHFFMIGGIHSKPGFLHFEKNPGLSQSAYSLFTSAESYLNVWLLHLLTASIAVTIPDSLSQGIFCVTLYWDSVS